MRIHQLHAGEVVAIRHVGTELYMGEDDAGEPTFTEIGPRTYLFAPEDTDTIGAAISAGPSGTETVVLHMTLTEAGA